MTIEENLLLGAYLRKDGQIADDVARRTRCSLSSASAARRPPRHALRRRAADAGHGQGPDVCKPRLLMLDEPSMGLSPIMMQQIMSTINGS